MSGGKNIAQFHSRNRRVLRANVGILQQVQPAPHQPGDEARELAGRRSRPPPCCARSRTSVPSGGSEKAAWAAGSFATMFAASCRACGFRELRGRRAHLAVERVHDRRAVADGPHALDARHRDVADSRPAGRDSSIAGILSSSGLGCVPIVQMTVPPEMMFAGVQVHVAIRHAHGARVEPHVDASRAHLATVNSPSDADSSGSSRSPLWSSTMRRSSRRMRL